MKRFALFTLLTLCLQTLVNGQQDSANKRAVRQLRQLEKHLHLNEDQVLQLQVILVNRDVAMDSIAHSHPMGPSAPPDTGRTSGFRRTDNRARRSIQQDADQKINAILTDDQKTLYKQWKQEQREKMKMRRQLNQGGDPEH